MGRYTMKVCQGERDTEVTHSISVNGPGREEYEQGVSVELCPLFDFSREPWMLLQSLTRQVILAHQVMIHTGMAVEQGSYTVVDAGCGYCELFALLKRARKAKGVDFSYIGVDIDKDKKIIAQQLRPTVDYRILNLRDIDQLPENPVECVVSGDVIEHFDRDSGVELLDKMVGLLYENGILVISYATPLSRAHRDNPFHLYEWSTEEMNETLVKLGMKIEDSFYLGIPSKEWSIQDDRLSRVPRDLARNVISVLSNAEGNEGFTIARRI